MLRSVPAPLVEEKAFGLRRAVKWDEAKHPRDSHGRFIEVGGLARLWGGGGLFKVDRQLRGGFFEVVNQKTGERRKVNNRSIEMVERPGGGKPTKSRRKLLAGQHALGGTPTHPDAPKKRQVSPGARRPAQGAKPKQETAAERGRFDTLQSVKAHWRQGGDQNDASKKDLADAIKSPSQSRRGSFVIAKHGDDNQWSILHSGSGERITQRKYKTKREAVMAANAYEDVQVGGKRFDWDSPGLPDRIREAGPELTQATHAARRRAASDFVRENARKRADAAAMRPRQPEAPQAPDAPQVPGQPERPDRPEPSMRGDVPERLAARRQRPPAGEPDVDGALAELENLPASEPRETGGVLMKLRQVKRDPSMTDEDRRGITQLAARDARSSAESLDRNAEGFADRPDRAEQYRNAAARMRRVADKLEPGGAQPGDRDRREGAPEAPGQAPTVDPRAKFSPVEQAKIRDAVDDNAAHYFDSPITGGKDDAARYTSEGHLRDLVDKHGLRDVWQAVAAEIDARPEVLHRSKDDRAERARARREHSDKLSADAHDAFVAGDYDRADELLNDAELADPHSRDKESPGFPQIREAIQRRRNEAAAGGGENEPQRQPQPGQGAPGAGLPGDRGEVLEDVPAEQGRPDGRPGGVLPRPGGPGEGPDSDRAGGRAAGDGTELPAEQGGVRPGEEVGGGGRAARPGVPAARAGDRGEAAGGPGPARVGGRGTATATRKRRGRATAAEPKPVAKGSARRYNPESQADLAPKGERAKLDANMAALRLLRKLEAEDRQATPEEQKVLARWAGWGSLPDVFNEDVGRFAPERAELKKLLTPEQYEDANHNILNAHYTDAKVVGEVWRAMEGLGFHGGDVLEPGSGSGNFMGFAPANAHMTGVELDPITAAISKQLYPDADVYNESFAKSPFREGVFDAVVGNVPFGRYPEVDKVYNPDNKFNIHDHFIIKALAATKPGGIATIVTSSWTLDKADPDARQAMAKYGDLLGAVRLPGKTHAEAAGTDVVTDVLVFRRRKEGDALADRSWLHAHPAVHPDGRPVLGVQPKDRTKRPREYEINDYFRDNPDKVLGTIEDGGFNAMAVSANGDVQAQSRAALKDIADKANAAGRGWNVDSPPDAPPLVKRNVGAGREGRIAYLGEDVEGTGVNKKGRGHRFEVVQHGRVVTLDVDKTQQAELRDLLQLRDAADEMVDAELTHNDGHPALAAARKRLNKLYDAYVAKNGPISRYDESEGIDSKTGAKKITRRNPPVMRHVLNDEGAASLFGLEKSYDPGTKKAEKADLFHTRQIDRNRNVKDHADTPEDALALAAERGENIDAETLGRLLNVRPEQVEDLVLGKGLAFRDPDGDGSYVPADHYLSGNIRNKLARAREVAEKDPRWQRNVAALEEVMPDDAKLDDVPKQLGAPWMGSDVVRAFAKSLMRTDVSVEWDKEDGWKVTTPSRGRSSGLEDEWGTPERSFYSLLESILKQQHKIITVRKKNPDGDGTYVDTKAGDQATAMAANIEAAWNDYLWSNSKVGDLVTQRYNQRFRSIVPRVANTRERAYPGMNKEKTLRPHQNGGVNRMVADEAVLLEHVVGSGKTFTLAAGAMELRRLGLANKIALNVPGPLIAQWMSEFRELYPNGRVLAVDSESLKGKGARKRFAAKVRNNDWDAVIFTGEAFESIPVNEESFRKYMQGEIDALDARIRKAKAKAGKKVNTKHLEIQKAVLKAQIEETIKKRYDEGSITFEELGIDYVMVDEAHRFKNLPFSTTIQGVQAPSGADRARDMHMKLEMLRDLAERRGGPKRVGTFATGTPISNSLAEMYTMMRMLRPDLLKEAGIEDFDSWAATLARIEKKVETDNSSNGYIEKVRFRGFTDAIGDGLRIWRTFADTVTAKHLEDAGYLKVPKLDGGARKVHVVERSAAQDAAKLSFKDRIEKIATRGGKPQKGDDIPIAVIGDGRAMAIDPRLMSERGLREAGIDRDDPTLESPKLDQAAGEIANIWRREKDRRFKVKHNDPDDAPLAAKPGALQMVFIDSSAPKKDQFNAYDALRDRLVAQGMDPSRIRYVQEAAGKPALKARMMEEARQGDIDVLIGSTEALGTGTNAQNRLAAMHHIEASWKPSDVEQREGRGLRQGNQYDKVESHVYITKGTHDEKTWDMIAYKQHGLDALQNGSYDQKAIEFADDVDPLKDFDTLAGEASEDPLAVDMRELQGDLKGLEAAKRNYDRQQSRARSIIETGKRDEGRHTNSIEKLDQAIAERVDTSGDKFTMSVRPDRHSRYNAISATSRDAAAEAMKTRFEQILSKDSYIPAGEYHQGVVGELGGFVVQASTLNVPGRPPEIHLTLSRARDGDHGRQLPIESVRVSRDDVQKNMRGVVTRLENRINGLESRRDMFVARRETTIREIGVAESQRGREFRQTDELESARERMRLVSTILADDATDSAGNPLAPEIKDRLREQYQALKATAVERGDSRQRRPSFGQVVPDEPARPTVPTPARAPETPRGPREPAKPSASESVREGQDALQDVLGDETLPPKAAEAVANALDTLNVGKAKAGDGDDDHAAESISDAAGDLRQGSREALDDADVFDDAAKDARADGDVTSAQANEQLAEDSRNASEKLDDAADTLDNLASTPMSEEPSPVEEAPSTSTELPGQQQIGGVEPELSMLQEEEQPRPARPSEVPGQTGVDEQIADTETPARPARPARPATPREPAATPPTETPTGATPPAEPTTPRPQDDTSHLRDVPVDELADDQVALALVQANRDGDEGRRAALRARFRRDAARERAKERAERAKEREGLPPLPPKPTAPSGTLNVLSDVANRVARADDAETRGVDQLGLNPIALRNAIEQGYLRHVFTGNPNEEGGPNRLFLTDAGREQVDLDDAYNRATSMPRRSLVPRPWNRDAAPAAAAPAATPAAPAVPTPERPGTRPGSDYSPEGLRGQTTEQLNRMLDSGNYSPLTVSHIRQILADRRRREPEREPQDRLPETPSQPLPPPPDTPGAAEAAAELDQPPEVRQEKIDHANLQQPAAATPDAPEAADTPEQVEALVADTPTDKATTPEQLEGEKFPPSPQQQAIFDAVLDAVESGDGTTKVEAKAGAGKTTTLEMLARRIGRDNPHDRIAYVAFNKSVQVEAEGRMPDNTEPRTGHSLAYQWAPTHIQDRTGAERSLRRADVVARHLGIGRDLPTGEGGSNLSPTEQAVAAMRAVDTWANSAEDVIGREHLPERIRQMPEATQDAIVAQADQAWADLTARDGRLKLSLDHVRKMWALSRPDFTKPGSGLKRRANVLFLDEAQDTPPVLAKVIQDQNMPKVVVGDADQAIYGFTGAVDYLSKVDADADRELNVSYRFGPQVAEIANRFLQMHDSRGRVVGAGPESRVLDAGTMEGSDAILVRSNGGAIAEIIREQQAGRLVGVPKGTKRDLLSLVETARFLKGEGRQPLRMHEDLEPFRTWDEVVREANKGDDPKLAMLERIVRENGVDELDHIVQQVQELGDEGMAGVTFTDMPHGLVAGGQTFGARHILSEAGFQFRQVPGGGVYKTGKNKGNPVMAWTAVGTPEKREATLTRARELAAGPEADVIVSTAHKAKGLEWDRVRIGDDFKGPKEDPNTGEQIMPPPEELRLAYVAVTRAKKELDPGSLDYVYDHSDPNGDASRRENVTVEPEQVREDLAAVTPETPETPAATTPEPERAPTPDVTPEEPAAPEPAPEALPEAPTPVVEPEVPERAPEVPAAPATPTPAEEFTRVEPDELRVGDVIQGKRPDGTTGPITVESAEIMGNHVQVTGRDENGNRNWVRIPRDGHPKATMARRTHHAGDDADRAWNRDVTPEDPGDRPGPMLPEHVRVGDLIEANVTLGQRKHKGNVRVTQIRRRDGLFHEAEVEFGPEGNKTRQWINLANKRPVNVLERAPDRGREHDRDRDRDREGLPSAPSVEDRDREQRDREQREAEQRDLEDRQAGERDRDADVLDEAERDQQDREGGAPEEERPDLTPESAPGERDAAEANRDQREKDRQAEVERQAEKERQRERERAERRDARRRGRHEREREDDEEGRRRRRVDRRRPRRGRRHRPNGGLLNGFPGGFPGGGFPGLPHLPHLPDGGDDSGGGRGRHPRGRHPAARHPGLRHPANARHRPAPRRYGRGELAGPVTEPHRQHMRDVAENPTLAETPSGGVAFWSPDGGKTFQFAHGPSGTSIGDPNLTASTWGGPRAAGRLAQAFENNIRDPNGQPFPWTEPLNPEAVRAWRSDRGEPLLAAMQRVRGDHNADKPMAGEFNSLPPGTEPVPMHEQRGRWPLFQDGTPVTARLSDDQFPTHDNGIARGKVDGPAPIGPMQVIQWPDGTFDTIPPSVVSPRNLATPSQARQRNEAFKAAEDAGQPGVNLDAGNVRPGDVVEDPGRPGEPVTVTAVEPKAAEGDAPAGTVVSARRPNGDSVDTFHPRGQQVPTAVQNGRAVDGEEAAARDGLASYVPAQTAEPAREVAAAPRALPAGRVATGPGGTLTPPGEPHRIAPATPDQGYTPQQLDALASDGGPLVAVQSGPDDWHLGTFKPGSRHDTPDGPAYTLDTPDGPVDIPARDLNDVNVVGGHADVPGHPVEPGSLPAGARVHGTGTHGRPVAGRLVSPDTIRDDQGVDHALQPDALVQPVYRHHAGQQPQPDVAPTGGEWTRKPDGTLGAASDGEWEATVTPPGEAEPAKWHVVGHGPHEGHQASGEAASTGQAKQEAADAVEAMRKPKEPPLGATPHDRQEPPSPEADRDKQPKEPPEPVAGHDAQWVPVTSLKPGDVARISGIDGRGRETTLAGWIVGGPNPVDVSRGRRGTRQMLAFTIGQDRNGGDGTRGQVYTSLNAVAARAELPSGHQDPTKGRALSMTEVDIVQGYLPEKLPVDSAGRGLFPGSVVHRSNDQGIVTYVNKTTATVNWGKGKTTDERPRTLTIAGDSQARPDGWTASGERVRPGQFVQSPSGAIRGMVSGVDADEVTIETPQGSRKLPAKDLVITGKVAPNAPDVAPAAAAELGQKAASELKPDDVILTDGATPWHVVSAERDGDRMALEVRNPATGEVHMLDADRGELMQLATGEDGKPADVTSADMPDLADPPDVQIRNPMPIDPVTDPTAPIRAPQTLRQRINDLGLDTDVSSPIDVSQSAARVRAGLPLTAAQAETLAGALDRFADDPDLPPGDARRLKRGAETLRRTASLARNEPPSVPDVPQSTRPARTPWKDLVEGDTVAVGQPDGSVAIGTIAAINPSMRDRVWRLKLAGQNGDHVATADTAEPVFLLPDLPNPDEAPAPDLPTIDPAEIARNNWRANVRPQVADQVAQAVNVMSEQASDAAADAEDEGHLAELADGNLANAATSHALEDSMQGFGDKLTAAGVDPNRHDDVLNATSEAVVQAAQDMHDNAVATVADVDPIPGESDADRSARTGRNLQKVGETVDVDHAAEDALDKAEAAGSGDAEDVPKLTPEEREQAIEQMTDAQDEDADRMVEDLLAIAAEENVEGQPADTPRPTVRARGRQPVRVGARRVKPPTLLEYFLDRAGREATRPSQRAVRAAALAASGGREPSPGLLRRIMRWLSDRRKAFLAKLGPALRRGFQGLRRLLRQAAAEMKRAYRDAAGFIDGHDRIRPRRGLNTSPARDIAAAADFAGQIAHWQGQLPEPGRFGRVQRQRPRYTARLADLVNGGDAQVTNDSQWELDRAADGGPGHIANSHMAAVQGMGAAVDDEVMARIRAASPALGDNPHETVTQARQAADDAQKDWRRLTAAGSPDAGGAEEAASSAVEHANQLSQAYAEARRQATLDVLGQVREIGPDGTSRLDVHGDPEAVAAVRWAEQMLPRDWLGAANLPINAVVGRSGSYTPHNGRLVVADSGGSVPDAGRYGSVALHELGHHLEDAIPDLVEAERAYFWARTSTGDVGSRVREGRHAAVSLAELFPGRGHTPDMIARLDWWLDPYMGLEADNGRYEVLSMALQSLLAGNWFMDDDLRRYVLGLLASLQAARRL